MEHIITKVPSVEFRKCTLPRRNTTYSSLIASMGVPLRGLRRLTVEYLSYDDTLSCSTSLRPLFRGLHNVIHLSISEACMSRLEEDLLEEFPNLTELDLSSNKIHEVSSNVLTYVPLLKSLNLGFNALREIQAAFFSRAENLEKLLLHKNSLQNLTGETFKVRCDQTFSRLWLK